MVISLHTGWPKINGTEVVLFSIVAFKTLDTAVVRYDLFRVKEFQ